MTKTSARRKNDMSSYVYIISNFRRTTLYIGVTNDLKRRIHEHKARLIPGFSRKYKLKYLVYYEEFPNMLNAIEREKQLKNWHRSWKINLIKNSNPTLKDLDAEMNSA